MAPSKVERRLSELERRIKELEQREPAVGYPAAATVPYWQPVPYWVYVTSMTGTETVSASLMSTAIIPTL